MSVPRIYHAGLEEWLDIGLAAASEGGGLYIAGDGASTYDSDPGDIEDDVEDWSLPGAHGRFITLHGTRGRIIRLVGNLRLSDAGLQSVRQQRDRFRATVGMLTFYDDDDTEYPKCRMAGFAIGPKRRIESVGNIRWVCPYEITLDQLLPAMA